MSKIKWHQISRWTAHHWSLLQRHQLCRVIFEIRVNSPSQLPFSVSGTSLPFPYFPCIKTIDIVPYYTLFRGQTSLPPLVPWGKGFVGEMIKDGARFITNGVISRTSDTALEVLTYEPISRLIYWAISSNSIFSWPHHFMYVMALSVHFTYHGPCWWCDRYVAAVEIRNASIEHMRSSLIWTLIRLSPFCENKLKLDQI